MDWSIIYSTSLHLASGIPAFLAATLVLAAARVWFIWRGRFRPRRALVETENTAMGVAFGGYILGIAVAVLGAITTRSDEHFLLVMGKILTEGVLMILLMQCALWINERVILRGFSVQQEICEDMNLGAGFCVAGSCLACGLSLNGAAVGLSVNWWQGLVDIGIYWMIGQGILVSGAFLYTRLAQYDVHDLIAQDDNVAVGIGFSSWLICLGLVVRASIVHAGADPLATELVRTGLCACVGVTCLLASQTLVTRLFAAWVPYEDEVELHGNIAFSATSACALLATTVLFAAIIQR